MYKFLNNVPSHFHRTQCDIKKNIYTKCLIGVSNMSSSEKQEIQLGNVDELASDALSVHKVFPFHEWSLRYSVLEHGDPNRLAKQTK